MDEGKDDQNKKQDDQAGDGKIEKTAEEELAECQKRAEEYLNGWKRAKADFLNYQKDEAKRLEEFVKFANEDLILEMIDVYDNLRSAYTTLSVPEDDERLNRWVDGILQVASHFRRVLKKYGVEKIKTAGEKFDPLLHEAVEGSDSEGGRLEEIRAGYMMHGKVIRPARVKLVNKQSATS